MDQREREKRYVYTSKDIQIKYWNTVSFLLVWYVGEQKKKDEYYMLSTYKSHLLYVGLISMRKFKEVGVREGLQFWG